MVAVMRLPVSGFSAEAKTSLTCPLLPPLDNKEPRRSESGTNTHIVVPLVIFQGSAALQCFWIGRERGRAIILDCKTGMQ